MSPRAKRSAPAQAIIAALSVHSHSGGATNGRPWRAASDRQRGANRLVGGDAAGDDQRGGLREGGDGAGGAIDKAIGRRLLEGGGEVGAFAVAGVRQGLPLPEHGGFEAGEGEMRFVAAEQRARQGEAVRVAGLWPRVRPPGRRGSRGRGLSQSCRRLRRPHRRWWWRDGGSGRRLRRRAAGNGRPRRAAADRGSPATHRRGAG